ncbi:MAG TPA: hypothetical protein VFS88_08920 [Micavibrio sp.]|nr:hypothetical protein [Micavibrio sp.]
MERPSSQRGSAIIMLFIAVALFGMLAYAFSQGSRTSMGWIEKEKQDAAVTGAQDCTNAINMAQKRLQARGCGSMISSLEDGSNPNTGAPADGSCSIFHPNGGGVKANCVPPPSSGDPCTTGSVGEVCSDGAFYIGDTGGNRIYAAPADEGITSQWSTEYVDTGATSETDGQSNSDNSTIVSAGAAVYPAVWACRNKAPPGTWYLPTKSELGLIWANRTDIDLSAKGLNIAGAWYWSSTEVDSSYSWIKRFNNGYQGGGYKSDSLLIRCVRR